MVQTVDATTVTGSQQSVSSFVKKALAVERAPKALFPLGPVSTGPRPAKRAGWHDLKQPNQDIRLGK